MKKNRFRGMILNSFNASGKWKAISWLLIVLVMSSAELYANGQKKLNLVLKNASIEEVFNAIEKQSEYRFLYKTDLVDIDKKVTINQRNAEIETVLKEVFAGTNIYFSLKEGDLVVVTPTAARIEGENQQDEKVVKGKVVDEKGEPLPGVAVFLKEDNMVGTITDFEGHYELKAPATAQVIVFSFIGMNTTEVTYSGQPSIDITMLSSYEEMDEVVVVAYGTQQKSNLTGSVASVKGEKLKDVTTPDVNGLIQGKAAGVMVTNSSGKPGETAKIRIRGKGSLNSSVEPLWVIDGVVSGTGAQLSPNEIESMSILKDASATALYGSRASNGVIVVTTKKGKNGENTVSFSAVTGLSQLHKGNFSVMNAQELFDYQKDWNTNLNEDVLKYDTDWFDKGTQTGISQNYNVSIAGGNEKIRTFVMGDYFNETGAVKGFDYDRYKTRVNLDYSVTDKFTIRSKMAGSFKETDSQQHDIGAFWTYMPWDSPYYEDGVVRNPKDDALEESYGETWYGRDKSNYYYNLQWNYSKTKTLGVNGSLDFEYEITPELTLVSTNNIGYRYYKYEQYQDPRSTSGMGDNGLLENSQSFQTTRFTNQMVKYQKNMGQHNFSAFLGYEYSDYLMEQFSAVGKGVPAGMEVLGVAAEPKSTGGYKYDWAIQSILFNANYVLKNRYMAQLSFRRDGSSRFGSEEQYGNFYTISAGWSMHEEAFMADIDWLNVLKLRASYGAVGNLPPNVTNPSDDANQLNLYPHLGAYTYTKTYNGIPAPWPAQMANPDLTWEKAFTTNIAVDARFFNRLDASIEFYDKNTSDLVDKVALDAMTGYTYVWRNVGKVNNKGFELTLGTDILRKTDLNWRFDFNIGINKNEIIELSGDEDGRNVNSFKRWEEGRDMDSFHMKEWVGVDSETGAPLWAIEDEETGEWGTTSNWNDATKKFVGKASPDFFGGFSTAVDWKDITLSANFSYMVGNDIYHSGRELFDSDGAYPTFNQIKFQDDWSRWQQPGDKATHPKALSNNSNKTSSRYIEDGSYLKLRNVTLSYNLPKTVLDVVRLSSARIYVSGDNLWTVSKFTGIDPEVAANNYGVGGTDRYPLTKKFVFGLNVNF